MNGSHNSETYKLWNLFVRQKVLHLIMHHLGRFLLLLGVIEYSARILCSLIIALFVPGSWVMESKEVAHHFLV